MSQGDEEEEIIRTPSVKDTALFQMKILEWYKKPSTFYRDMFGHPPYFYQENIINLMNQPEKHKRIMAMSAAGSGKTEMLGGIALYFAIVLSDPLIYKYNEGLRPGPHEALILSGSLVQAKKVYGYTRTALTNNKYMNNLIAKRDLKQTDTVFRNGGGIKAFPNSLTATQGQHMYLVIVDEAALVQDFQLDDCYRIVGAHNGIIIWSGTPTTYESKFVKMFEETEQKQLKKEKTDWELFTWSAKDCPALAPAYEEAKRTLSEDMIQIFWEGKPYPLVGTLIPRDSLIEATRGLTQFKRRDDWKVIFGVDWGWCLSGDTEVLTNNGWKTYDKILSDDLIYTYNQNTKMGEYQPYSNLRHRSYSGEMISLKSRNLDILAKWDHGIFLYDRDGTHPHLHDIGDHTTHHILPRFSPQDGDIPSHFLLPSITSKRSDLDYSERKLPIIPFLRVLGWYLTEGNCYSKGIAINQETESLIPILKEDLTNFGYHWFWSENRGQISSVQLKEYFKQFGLARDKFIPDWIKSLDYTLLIELIDTMMLGDGDKKGNRFNTYSKRLAEDFAEIVCKSGIGYAIVKARKDKGYRVDILTRHSSPNKSHYSETDYDGEVWCLNVPNEIIYIRRNGYPTFIHNSDPSSLIIVQTDGNRYEVLEAHKWKETDFDAIHNYIESKAKELQPNRIFTDASDKGENLRLLKRGLPVFGIAFNKEKAMMQSRVRDLFVKNLIKVPEENFDDSKIDDFIYELRTYTWEKSSGEDMVDGLLLATRDFFPKEGNPIYISSGRPVQRKRPFMDRI